MSNISIVGSSFKIKWVTFSDGAETCDIKKSLYNVTGYRKPEMITIECKVEDCNRDLLRIGLVKDALDRLEIPKVKLKLSYLFNARADRVFDKGLPLPIKLFANILNSYNFDKVYIDDCHSEVGIALIDNVVHNPQWNCFIQQKHEIERFLGKDYTLCAPDLGATKKIFELSQKLKHDSYIQAIKVRDVKTGNIVKCDLLESKVSGNVVISDDCADGGASFIYLAEKLKERGADKVGLFVTHGIFSKGLKVLEGKVDYIWCRNIICDYISDQDLIDFNEK